VFVNQSNDDIYVAYVGGTAAESQVAAFYQKSVNGGANWGGQTALQADAKDDMRWISAGAMKSTWGGKFQPVWFNDDFNDLFTNTDNGISIAAAAGGTTVTPETIALITTPYIPVLDFGIIPSTLALSTTMYAPVLGFGIIPDLLALILTEYIPVLKETLTPTTLSLSDTEFVPILKETLTPSTLALSDTEYAPVLGTGIIPATLVLITTGYIPSILVSGAIIVIPTTLALTLTEYAPILKGKVTPGTLALTLTSYIPILREVFTPTTVNLILTKYIPGIVITGGTVIIPSLASLVLDTYAPSLIYWEWVDYPLRVPISRLDIKRLGVSRAPSSHKVRVCTWL